MAKSYSIIIFPQLQQAQCVAEIRQQYDPLATKIRPHISLLFPLAPVNLTAAGLTQLIEDKLMNMASFSIELAKISWQPDHYLIWQLTTGCPEVQRLHDR